MLIDLPRPAEWTIAWTAAASLSLSLSRQCVNGSCGLANVDYSTYGSRHENGDGSDRAKHQLLLLFNTVQVSWTRGLAPLFLPFLSPLRPSAPLPFYPLQKLATRPYQLSTGRRCGDLQCFHQKNEIIADSFQKCRSLPTR